MLMPITRGPIERGLDRDVINNDYEAKNKLLAVFFAKKQI